LKKLPALRCNPLDDFAKGAPDDLPPARREKYEQSGRNTKVLVKKLVKIAQYVREN
jgi:hypothetical protein